MAAFLFDVSDGSRYARRLRFAATKGDDVPLTGSLAAAASVASSAEHADVRRGGVVGGVAMVVLAVAASAALSAARTGV